MPHNFRFGLQLSKRTIANIVLILLIFSGLAWFISTCTTVFSWDFRNNLWGPSRLLLHGQSPYKIESLFENSNSLWMPMTIGAFFPIGFLPLQQASNLWIAANIMGLLLIVWLSSGQRKPSIRLFAIGLIIAFLFPPTIDHLRLGQITIIITLLFIIVTHWENKLHPLILSLILAVALSKPQLAVLVFPGLVCSYIKSYGVRTTIKLAALFFLGIIILLIPLYLSYSHWFFDFTIAVRSNPSWAHPSSLIALTTWLHEFGGVAWAGIAIAVFTLNIWIWLNLPRKEAVLWSMALTPLATPYIWSWDFVMIIPLFIASLFQFKLISARLFLLLGYISCWGLAVKILCGGDVSNYYYWWVPAFLLGVIGIGYLINSKATKVKAFCREPAENSTPGFE